MKAILYPMTQQIVAGTTLKDSTRPEQQNMALHACEDPIGIAANRAELASFLGCTVQDFVCANQTHSDRFYKVTAADRGRGATDQSTAIPDTDALYTYEPGIVLCSFTADCVPVLFYDETKGLVGAIHSGWQGTVKEITKKVMDHLIGAEGCKPGDIHIHLGPALSQEKFEVDDDVFQKFKRLGYADEYIFYKPETNKYHIDNQLTVKRQCELAGIPSDHITMDRTCTYQSPDGFSYREDRKSGRHLSYIMKKTKNPE